MCRAVYVATGLVYFLRLPDSLRNKLDLELLDLTRMGLSGQMSMVKVMEEETTKYLDQVVLEDGIARNKALKVILYAWCISAYPIICRA